jgi:membrane protease YdiL (CAAX protease family)
MTDDCVPSSGDMRGFVNVWWFFLIAIAVTWLFQLPLVLDSRGILHSPPSLSRIALYVSQTGPFVAAFLLTYLSDGRGGVTRLLRRGWSIGFKKVWWIPTLLLLPAMEGLAVSLAAFLGGEPFPELAILARPGTYARSFLFLLYLAALEEYGWRGYALDRLQMRWNALTSSLVLAAFWGPWHLPQWFMGGAYRSDVPFFGFWYGIVMEAILLTWLCNNTRTSLLPVILFHALMNVQVFPTWENPTSAWMFVLIWTLVTIAVIVVWGPRELVRRRQDVEKGHRVEAFS